jgi:hypothetical protein
MTLRPSCRTKGGDPIGGVAPASSRRARRADRVLLAAGSAGIDATTNIVVRDANRLMLPRYAR